MSREQNHMFNCGSLFTWDAVRKMRQDDSLVNTSLSLAIDHSFFSWPSWADANKSLVNMRVKKRQTDSQRERGGGGGGGKQAHWRSTVYIVSPHAQGNQWTLEFSEHCLSSHSLTCGLVFMSTVHYLTQTNASAQVTCKHRHSCSEVTANNWTTHRVNQCKL